MAAALKVLQKRIRSIKSIEKITKSMKMISAAKFVRADKVLRDAKAFGIGSQAFYHHFPVDPYKMPTDEGLVAFAITGDRGLCGSCNSYVCKKVAERLKKGGNIDLICIGDKARAILKFRFANNIKLVVSNVRSAPSFADASRIVKMMEKLGLLDKVWLIAYNKYYSMAKYVTQVKTLANFKRISESSKYTRYEISDEEIDDYILFSKASLVFYAMAEEYCSEQSARMTAMDNASKNATEMMGKLTIRFNRYRQGLITNELIEIISGASALETKDQA